MDIKNLTRSIIFKDKRGRRITNPSIKRRREYVIYNPKSFEGRAYVTRETISGRGFNINTNDILENPDEDDIIDTKPVLKGKIHKWLGPTHVRDIKRGKTYVPSNYILTKNQQLRRKTRSLLNTIKRRGNLVENGVELPVELVTVSKNYIDTTLEGLNREEIDDKFWEFIWKNLFNNIKGEYYFAWQGFIVPNKNNPKDTQKIKKNEKIKLEKLKDFKSAFVYHSLENVIDTLNDEKLVNENAKKVDQLQIYILKRESVPVNNYSPQFFKEANVGNCVLNRIKQWVDTTKGNQKKMSALRKKIKIWEDKYLETGIPHNKLQELADDLRIKLVIENLMGKVVSTYAPTKTKSKSVKVIKYCNSVWNHLGPPINVDMYAKREKIEEDELNYIIENEPCVWVGGFDKPSIVFTENNIFAKQEAQNISDIMKKLNQFRLSTANNVPDHIIDYVCSTVHVGLACEVNNTKKSLLHEIDMTKAYKNYTQDPQFKGIPNLCQYHYTDKILGEGFYYIKNFKWQGKFKFLTPLRDHIYFSSTLRTLKELNAATFDIIYGVHSYTTFKENIFPPDFDDYRKLTGILMSGSDKKRRFFTKGNYQMASLLKYQGHDVYKVGQNFIEINVEKSTRTTLAHVASTITASTFNMLLRQIAVTPLEIIDSITLDSLLCTEIPKNIIPGFRLKGKMKPRPLNYSCIPISYRDMPALPEKTNTKILKRLNSFVGAGGTGKSYYMRNGNYFNVVYSVDSNILTYNNCGNMIPRNLTVLLNNANTTRFRVPGIVALDECSKYSEETINKLIKLYPYTTFVFLGDWGYQLGCFDGEQSKPMGEITKFTTNYRFKCATLKMMCQELRDCIDKLDYKRADEIARSIETKKFIYNHKKDIILCRSNARKDYFTNKYKHLEKYCITKTTINLYNGQIFYEKPVNNYELRHGFTVHQIQGQTYEGKILIDYNKPKSLEDLQWLYTAISRAVRLNKLFLM